MILETTPRRYIVNAVGRQVFRFTTIVEILVLMLLTLTIVDQIAGIRAVQYDIQPDTLAQGRALDTLSSDELSEILVTHLSGSRPLVIIRDELLDGGDTSDFTTRTVGDLLQNRIFPHEAVGKTVRELTPQEVASILATNLSNGRLQELVNQEVVGFQILESWNLLESVFQRERIAAEVAADYPDARLEFGFWLNWNFLNQAMSSDPAMAGIRTALLGSLWVVILTILVSFPISLGAAIYLEEYAPKNWLTRLIEVNVGVLAGVPSVIFGLLGLAWFVRSGEFLTGGRTILSGALTMSLLVMPVIVINSQVALRSVPNSRREKSYLLSATKWQTIRFAVLPSAAPGILTGLILAVARAIGETAPLIIVGASTYITVDPNGLQSRFTVLPILIFDWAKRPQNEFHHLAASASVVLLILVVFLNGVAIMLREYYRRKMRQ